MSMPLSNSGLNGANAANPLITGRLDKHDYLSVNIKCPHCGKKHTHGVSEDMFGCGSHRTKHCWVHGTPGSGYFITLPDEDVRKIARGKGLSKFPHPAEHENARRLIRYAIEYFDSTLKCNR